MGKSVGYSNTKDILKFHCPRYKELPHIPLYKEQVITFIEDSLRGLNLESGEKLITPTMVNNYVKQKVVAPPKDKKYNETHLAYLIVVCILKHVFSLTEICQLIKIQINTCPIEQAYDCFCVELEAALKTVLTNRDFSKVSLVANTTEESELVRSSAMCFAHNVYIQKCLRERSDCEKKLLGN